MKNLIKKSFAFLSALVLVASIAATTYSTAFAYDENESDISILWIEEDAEEETSDAPPVNRS